jgi:hypothetical protein
MPRQDTTLEAEGAEFLVLGNLLIEGIPAYKNLHEPAGLRSRRHMAGVQTFRQNSGKEQVGDQCKSVVDQERRRVRFCRLGSLTTRTSLNDLSQAGAAA